MNYYSIPEMASMLDVCRETVVKYIREKGFKAKPGKDNLGRNINVYTDFEYSVIKDTIEGRRVVEQNYYTTNQVADLAGVSASYVCVTAAKHNIYKIVKPSDKSKKAYFPKESAEKLLEIIADMRQRRRNIQKRVEEKKAAENTASAELHPLVTDKKFLITTYFPDITPKCFMDLDA